MNGCLKSWEQRELSELVDEERGICYGIVQPGSHTENGVPIIRVNNIKSGRLETNDVLLVSAEIEAKYQRSRLRGGEVLLTLVGSLGESAVAPAELAGWNVARAVGVIPVKPEIGARWVELCLRSPIAQHFIGTRATTTVQATFNLRDVADIPIPLPPKDEREAIASVLGALDDKIELNRRMNETLEALAQTLFKSWFARLPGRGQVPACRSLGAGRDATANDLPKGWRYATIAELCEINSWTLGKGDELDQIKYVEISEVMRGNIATIQSYERGEEPSRARRRLRHGDTVLSTVRPDRGAYFLCLNPSPNLIGSTGFAVLTPAKAPWSFIHAAMTQPEVFEYLGQQADGGAYPAVRPEIIGGLQVPLPNDTAKLKAFHDACAPLYERAEVNRRESRTLAGLRDALLPKLLSGELRVPSQMLWQAGGLAIPTPVETQS